MLVSYAALRALGLVLASQQFGLGFDAKLRADTPLVAVAGAQGELSITILDTPHPGAAMVVRLRSDAVTLPNNRLGPQDIVDPQARQPRLRARFVAPPTAGRYEVEGLVSYVTCVDERCRPHHGRVVWIVDVTSPQSEG